MERFTYAAPRTVKDAVQELSSSENVKVLAGGTTLVDLMKNGVERPQRLIDVTGIRELNEFAIDGDELRLGALVRMSAVADHPEIKRRHPILSEALWRGASQQLRNMARLPWEGMSFSAPVVRTSAIPNIPATSDNRELAAPRSMASTVATRCSGRASSVSLSTPAIGQRRSQPSMRRSIL